MTLLPAAWLRSAGLVLLLVAWAVAAHMTSAQGESSGWGAAVALAPLIGALALALCRLPNPWLAALAGISALGVLAWLWPFLKARVALLYYVQHLGVNCLLAAFFGRSLLGPGESLVTRMARRVHGGVLSPGQMAYTRKVTLAWSTFFVAMALISSLLFVQATTEVWSLFANVLGGPLIVMMFASEMLCRRYSLPAQERGTLADAVRAWKARRTGPDP